MYTHGWYGDTVNLLQPKGNPILFNSLVTGSSVMIVGEYAATALREGTLTSRGTYLVKGLRIFKSGTFKDSMGIERTWTENDLVKMAENFNTLRNNGILVDVPVRSDHTRSVKDVVGWFASVYVDPSDRRFLSCDIEFTEPDAYQKWQRGTFRSRSSEIGMYETNDGTTYFPTVVGLAFVDIGAAEGLYNKEPSKAHQFTHVVMDKENDTMNLEAWLASGKSAEDWIKAVEYAAWLDAANYAQALEDQFKNENGTPPVGTPPVEEPPAGTPPAGTPPVLVHSAPVNVLHFTVNGQAISDPGTVQAHIHMLEQFRHETIQGGRRQYVTDLVKGNKLPATQLESTIAFVASLDDKQFESYRASMDAAPVHSLFGSYGMQTENPANPQQPAFGAPVVESLGGVALAEEIVSNHQRAGKSVEFIQTTPSYKILVQHNKAPF